MVEGRGAPGSSAAMDRRRFLRVASAAGGGILVAVVVPGCGPGDGDEAPDPAVGPAPEAHRVTAWVRIDTAGVVTVRVPVPEIGQGVRTSLAVLVAEELEVPWEDVRAEQAGVTGAGDDLGPHPIAGGSNAVRAYWTPLRRAGAVAREALVAAAAARWGVSPGRCRVQDGRVIDTVEGRSEGYGDLAEEAAVLAARLEPDSIDLKDPSAFDLVGRGRRSLDQQAIVTGRMTYGVDVRRPGMHFAAVARCPVYGGTVVSVDDEATRAVPGVTAVVRVPSVGAAERPYQVEGVAVVADSTWASFRGREALRVEWDTRANDGEATERIVADAREALGRRGESWREAGDVDRALAAAASRISADYHVPFIVHAPMEPPACTAQVGPDSAELWAPTQMPVAARGAVADLLGLAPEAVTVHVVRSGGGFGRRLSLDHCLEAVQVARRLPGPVQVVWSREDDIRHGFFRPLHLHRLEAGVDPSGRLSAFLHRQAGTSRYAFRPNEVPARSAFRAGTWPGGLVPAHRLEYHLVRSNLPRGPLRAPGHNNFTFAVESFLDEVAVAAGRDPLEFRLDLLGAPRRVPYEDEADFDTGRMAGVLRSAAEAAGWGRTLPEGWGRGIAATYTFGSYAAEVVEASVDPESGRIRVHRVVGALDCGRVVNPLGAAAQVEGGIVDGLAAALHQEITVVGGAVQQSNYHDFPLLRWGEAPEIEVVLIDGVEAPSGAGEPPYVPVAAALANAVADATGVRLRELPLRPERVRAALA